MSIKIKPQTSQARIIVGLPNLQDQIRMVNRIIGTASELELERWEGVGELLAELYGQLQQRKQVTVYRLGKKSDSKPRSE